MSREPIFNFSEPGPVRFAALLVLIHALLSLTPLGRVQALTPFVLLRPAEYTDGTGWFATAGHAFVHSSWSHVIMNSFMLIIFAIPVIRGARVLAVRKGRSGGETSWWLLFLGSAIAGAFAQWAWWTIAGATGWENITHQSAVGASGGVSGLFAAAGWALGGQSQMVKFGAAWLLINIFLVVFEAILGVGIAWAAHLGGFLGGMILAPVFVAANSARFSL